MKLDDLKSLAQQFREVAKDQAAVRKLAIATLAEYPDDEPLAMDCARLIQAGRRSVVEALCDEIEHRQEKEGVA